MSLMGMLDRVADTTAIDKVVEPVRRVVQGALRPQALRDFLHGTWLGHPLRPAATTLIGAGVAAAVPTALAGAADWSEAGSGVRRLGAVHAAANGTALGLYVGSLIARGKGRGALGRGLAYAGLGIAGSAAAIGGHMSYSQSAGVSHSATAARALTSDWIDLGPLDDLPEGRPALRTGAGSSTAVPLAVVRRGTRVDVFIGACSHLSGPLDEGSIEAVRGSECLVCPWHGSAYDLDTGEPRRGPAANAQEKLEVRMSAGRVLARVVGRNR
jgi:nitrite reductase/ring-hydroxylating ferredoxin subunit